MSVVLLSGKPVKAEDRYLVGARVDEDLERQLAELKAKLADAVAKLGTAEEKEEEVEEVKVANGVKKNHVPSKPNPNRKYVLLDRKMKDWGRVPQQQRDISQILSNCMEVGKPYSEAEVFGMLADWAPTYESLRTSVQDPTWLFRLYRGLKNDGKRAGFLARDFVRVIG